LDWGPADSLTSLPINLAGFTAEDSVHLVFHFQCGGKGNQPDADGILGAEGDSLILEFYSPLQQGEWFRAWSIEGGIDPNEFQRVIIPITDFVFLQSGFKFRFINKCTLHGAVDHWNLDYIILNSNIYPSQFVYSEVAFQNPSPSLLTNKLTSMPWSHFLTDPAYYTQDSITYYQRNLGETSNIATTVRISENGITNYTSSIDANTQGNGYSIFSRTRSLESYTFDSPNTDSVTFQICAAFSPTDIHTSNDTMCIQQHFSNYYAYDDGSAERAYGLQNAGGKMAIRFNTPVEDTLLGYYAYFCPIQYVATDQTFIMQAWSETNGTPSELLTAELDNFTFHQPHYYESGPDLFIYYPLQTPISIPAGNFFVGCIQQNAISLNFGLDKNTNANGSLLFYQLQGQSTWLPSNITGSVMLRPVFKSAMPNWTQVDEQSSELLHLYPNPSHDVLTISGLNPTGRYEIAWISSEGKLIGQQQASYVSQSAVVTTDLSPGMYFLRITDLKDQAVSTMRFIKQ
ncbi:MAG: T9SS type A sorting domain-containing protein, partial [Flavobacteriales bacterium]